MKLLETLKTPIKPGQRKVIKWLWIAFVAVTAAMLIFFYLVYNGLIGYMPPVEELKNPHDRFASVIYSADGQELGRYFRNTGNRVYADFDEISQNVVDALISTEDARFEDHSGIDVRALARVGVKTLLLGQRNAGGGSTITQQLAKQLYSPESHGLMSRMMQKPIEWMIAVKLERFYSKEEIIKMYLNQFDFLYNAVGIKSAAHVYFGKTPEELTVEEAATLVGMVKNPAYYNPVRRPERTLQRRNVVLDQMVRNDKLTQLQADSLKALPLKLDFHRVDHKEGLAPYFREELRRMLRAHKPSLSDYAQWDRQSFYNDSIAWENNPLYGWIDKNPKPDGSKYDIYTDGLKIYTTIDSRMQKYAEDAMEEHMSKKLQPAFFREKRGSQSAPYTTNRTEVSQQQIDKLIEHSMQQTDRYRLMKKSGASKDEIEKAFSTPREMKVFSYHGTLDTIMTPLDSMLYNKHFLRAGFMAMEPKNGHVKAYVGGPDFEHFQYDMVSTGRRQIGSTVKPFLYTYAMEEGFTPCDQFLNEQPVLYDENGRPWAPRNSGKSRIGEMVDLRWALTNSNNWISARLISRRSCAPCTISASRPILTQSCRSASARPTYRSKRWSPPIRLSPTAACVSTPFSSPPSLTPTATCSPNSRRATRRSSPRKPTGVSSRCCSTLLTPVRATGYAGRRTTSPPRPEARPERRTPTPTAGSWLSRPDWWPAHGSEARSATSISTPWPRDRAHRWRCLSTACS